MYVKSLSTWKTFLSCVLCDDALVPKLDSSEPGPMYYLKQRNQADDVKQPHSNTYHQPTSSNGKQWYLQYNCKLFVCAPVQKYAI